MTRDIFVFRSNKIMRHNAYAAKPERFNPEFIGIAHDYSQHKQRRKISESTRFQLETDFIYSQMEDIRLNKTIEAKAKELSRLRSAKQRQNTALKQKQARHEMQAAQLQALKCENNKRREQARRKREDARQQLLNRNRSERNKIDEHRSRIKQYYVLLNESILHSNRDKYQTVKEDKQLGKMRVDAYHRNRNLNSLKDYKNRIEAEKKLERRHAKIANKHQQGIKKLSQSVNLKRELLDDIEKEIECYITNYKPCVGSANKSRNRSNQLNDSRLFISECELNI